MRIHKNVFELIGNTPLVELTNYENNHGLDAGIIAKVEYFEPAGSIKDRIAKAMIDEARGKRSARCRHGHHRANERQHRHWPCCHRRRAR